MSVINSETTTNIFQEFKLCMGNETQNETQKQATTLATSKIIYHRKNRKNFPFQFLSVLQLVFLEARW